MNSLSNRNFWDINLCGNNKWKGGNRANGEAFPGSSTFFVWTKDGYHLVRTFETTIICFGQSTKNGQPNRPFKYRLADALIHQAVRAVGFTIAERFIYKH